MESSSQASRKYALECQFLNSCFLGNNIVNRKELVEFLIPRNSQQLKLICQTYASLYNRDILSDLSEMRTTDVFANVIYLRISEAQERDAAIVRDAMFGWRVNLRNLIEVVCTRSSSDLNSIKQAYRVRYSSNFEQDVASKTAGSYKEILLAVLCSNRTYGGRVDMSMAMCDAKTLYEALESGNSVDWNTITSLITDRNSEQVRAVLVSYKELYGREFSKFLKCNKCGKFGKDLRVFIRGIQYPERFLAKQLRGAMQNSADGREVITRIVITRLEVDIKAISNAFAAKTGWSLGNLVRKEFSNQSNHADKDNGLVAKFLLELLQHYC